MRHMNARFSSMADMAVVDLEVIKAWTIVPSETIWTRNGFRDLLLERDIYCVFRRDLDIVYISSHTAGVLTYVFPPFYIEWRSNRRLLFLWFFFSGLSTLYGIDPMKKTMI